MATVTKRDLVNNVSEKTGLTQSQVFEVIQQTVNLISASLAKGNRVVVRNFGTFLVKEMKAKVGRNPKNPGKNIPIPARSVVKFKPGKEMKTGVSGLGTRPAKKAKK